ncbi:hypothetical protein D3C72_1196530 [compost metagenome]
MCRLDQGDGGGGDPVLRGGGEVRTGFGVCGVRRPRDQGAGLHVDFGQLIGQQFRGRGFPYTEHLQGVEVADDLAGFGPAADARLDVTQGLGVGSNLDTRTAALVDQRDEFIPHQFVELVGMQVDRHLIRRAGGARQAVVDAVLVDVAGDGDQIGEHRIADSCGDFGVGQGIQANVDNPAFADDLQPIEDRPRIVQVCVVGGQ